LRLLAVVAALTALLASGSVLAGPQGHGGGGGGGGFHGGGHAAGGFHGAAGGFHGGGAYGGYHGGGYGGYHGGGYGGYHGGYGYGHGGYGYGYRGGYYGGRYWGGWGYGLGLGLFVGALPWYYSTYWWDGVPYYYADNTYYVYNDTAGQYQTVAPPAGLAQPGQADGTDPNQEGAQAGAVQMASAGPGPANSPQIFMYPKAGQSPEQQARDRTECDQWASQQTGATLASRSPDYFRANAACLEARNYSVK
jgi:hypothetical protein